MNNPEVQSTARRRLNKTLYPYILILPALLILVIMNFYPTIYSVVVSLSNYSLVLNTHDFIGLQNYFKLFSDKLFLNSVCVTFEYVVGAVLLEFALGLLIALLLHSIKNSGRIFLTFFLLPMMLTPIIVGIMWRFMLNYDVGIINFLINFLGLHRIPFLATQPTALPSIIIADIWQWTPFMVLFLYSGLQSLPVDPFEAAKIDGASEFQMFKFITLPSLKSIILISLLIRGMDAFREYDKIYTMTNGGPGNATESVSFYVYRQAFKFFDIGYAAAAAFILLLITIIASKQFVNRMPE